MQHEIIKYLSKHVSVSDDLVDIIIESTIVKTYKKGVVLLREGDPSNKSYFVLKGCVRRYLINDGVEKTLEIYTEEQPILPLSYGKGTPSEHFLECVEDTTLVISTPEHEKAMFLKYPQFESVCRIMSDTMMSGFQESLVNYKMATPEERYLYLLKNRPDLFQRVPLYQLASYLGIKPESLSRLRKRLARNNKKQ